MATQQAPDWSTMYNRINQAWNTTLTRADEQRQRYLRDLGYDANLPTYTSQAAALAQGKRIPGADASALRWGKNPYSALHQVMQAGGREKQMLRENMLRRGISGGLANQGEQAIDFATGGQRLAFGTALSDALNQQDRSVSDAALQYQQNTAEVDKAKADYEAEQAFLRNERDPATNPPATTPPATPPGTTPGTPSVSRNVQKFLDSLKGNDRARLNAIYAYIRKNKGKINKTDYAMINKMAAKYRLATMGGGGTMGSSTTTMGTWNPPAGIFDGGGY